MAEEGKSKKPLILGIAAGVVVIAIAIVLVVVFVINKKGLGDDYFVSDGSKYVLNMDTSDIIDGEAGNSDYTPVKTHVVYEYSGDTITNLKSYYEYKDEETAKLAYEAYQEYDAESAFEKVERDGKYLIITSKKEEYENLKASEVKSEIDLYESLKNATEE